MRLLCVARWTGDRMALPPSDARRWLLVGRRRVGRLFHATQTGARQAGDGHRVERARSMVPRAR